MSKSDNSPPVETGNIWRNHLIGLAVVGAAIITLFARDAVAMAGQWWNSSTYSHCLLVLPIIGWLVWLRVPEVKKLMPHGWSPGLLWLAGGACLWMVGDVVTMALARQLGLVVMLQGCVATMLGPQVTRGLLFPLFYSFFLVPFGDELVPPMQLITADMAMAMLRLTGIPAHIDGIFITTPAGLFAVAEACSGVKFLVAMAALSVLAAHLCFKSWPRRALFIVFAMAVPILANGVRASGTIWMAEQWGMDTAVGADHLIYGWIFFGMVMVLVGLVAAPWFDRSPEDMPIDAAYLAGFMPGRGIALSVVLPLALSVAALPFGLGLWGNATVTPMQVGAPLSVPGWQVLDNDLAADGWSARFDGADVRSDTQLFDLRGNTVVVTIAGYARQGEGKEMVGFGQGAVDPDGDWRWEQQLAALGPGRVDRIASEDGRRDVLTVYAIGGELTARASKVKLLMLRNRLTGGDERAYALLISARERHGQSGRDQISTFVRAAGGLDALVARLTQQR